MGGSGAISGMVTSIKNNLKSKSNRKTARDRNGEYQARVGKPLQFEDKMSAKDHQLHRRQLRSESLKSNFVLVGTILVIVSVVVWVLVVI